MGQFPLLSNSNVDDISFVGGWIMELECFVCLCVLLVVSVHTWKWEGEHVEA